MIASKFVELESSRLPATKQIEVPFAEEIAQQWVETSNRFGNEWERANEAAVDQQQADLRRSHGDLVMEQRNMVSRGRLTGGGGEGRDLEN